MQKIVGICETCGNVRNVQIPGTHPRRMTATKCAEYTKCRRLWEHAQTYDNVRHVHIPGTHPRRIACTGDQHRQQTDEYVRQMEHSTDSEAQGGAPATATARLCRRFAHYEIRRSVPNMHTYKICINIQIYNVHNIENMQESVDEQNFDDMQIMTMCKNVAMCKYAKMQEMQIYKI